MKDDVANERTMGTAKIQQFLEIVSSVAPFYHF